MRKSTPENPTKNLLEWTVFGISSGLVLVTLTLLTLAAFGVEEGPAEMRAETGTPVSKDGWIRIPVTVKNNGERVAANVEVKVCLGHGEGKREAGFTIDFVPRGGSRAGAVSFRETGEPAVVECEVIGYEEP
ncbi:hypothetical protein JIN84_14620 [Luteolibacter yonseiensis]|uniref:TIGR02588 family protein n=1 Tax=Luteolibacter yonseiensis TaxID=1144680 RepID=A0A934R5Y7_9BACT|nr:hypothetical protein [Luteolibacter yonseiensis]MBK1816856.1 hypothetical protein [Luteolibacter yonseiensis]